ncbi:RsfA family transcriptional regulator [Fredinandcohnia quinoae]|uniref:RsfA family transcriptional regulator n=1 Tax=Fredinandcohnia quinoae TaxID=2918902 RepID=A0AAW5E1A4_9BACI|nr:RsfA family transcriptional regulator [Fredinandcohnia sp. SECRCQ15]MCH1623892.1 RsfA family transcriptional regulator [Fredinandcohnia sp. SECRCQ15]
MTTTRQDAWTQDEDLLLAEVVLRHIREGGTQLGAFEEVGRRLTRTAAACGFRWNSFVRKQYKSGIELAKKQRKDLKKQVNTEIAQNIQPEVEVEAVEINTSLSLREIISLLQEYEKTESDLHEIIKENKLLKKQLEHLQEHIQKLSSEKITLENNIQLIEEDYKALIEIMERARKMVVLQEDERSKKVKFQMDRNGNLERIENK